MPISFRRVLKYSMISRVCPLRPSHAAQIVSRRNLTTLEGRQQNSGNLGPAGLGN